MSGKAFLDTNVLIYFYSENDVPKRQIAYKALNNYTCITSTQAFNEASNVWFNKFNWSKDKIKKHLDNVELVCDEVIIVQKKIIYKALDLKECYKYSYYDCLMLASALECGCNLILTEDIQDGQIIENALRIVDIFKSTYVI